MLGVQAYSHVASRIKALLPGYHASLTDENETSYETLESDWNDKVDLWPGITHIHIRMYLLLNKSPYSSAESLDCYINFISGWAGKVMVKKFGDKRHVIAKVSRLLH